MAFGTSTLTSAFPARDLMAALQPIITGAGFTLAETYGSPANGNWINIAFGGGKFVMLVNAVQSVGLSTDGINWTQKTLPISANWTALAYGNNTWVLLANSSASYVYSTDNGTTWIAGTMPIAGTWQRNLSFGNGLFVCFHLGNAYTSPDGINWTTRTLPVSGTTWVTSGYGNGMYVAVQATNSIAVSSPDGITWTQRAMSASLLWAQVVYGNSTFVAVASSTTVANTSPDGITWTARAMPASLAWATVAFGNGLFVALSNTSTTIATSPDGITWTSRASVMPSSSWSGLAYGANVFAASQNGATVATSPDGLVWTARNTPGNATTPVADVYKSPGTSNTFGTDWYLILRRLSDFNTTLYYQVAEQYDVSTHKANNLGGVGLTVAPTAAPNYTNSAGATAPDSLFGTNAFLSLTTTAFSYWWSVTPDRAIITIKSTGEAGFYAGLYEDMLPSGVTVFPLVCARMPVDQTVAIGNSTQSAGGFTREPGQTVSVSRNFEAVIHSGMTMSNSSATIQPNNFMPMTSSGALYGNQSSLSRVMIGSGRSVANTPDAVRGLLYNCFASTISSVAGDTVSAGGKTYVRVCGATTTYGYFVDQSL